MVCPAVASHLADAAHRAAGDDVGLPHSTAANIVENCYHHVQVAVIDDGAVGADVVAEIDAEAEGVKAVVWGCVYTGKPSRVGLLTV